ncbi:DUF1598 domain-containing protein [Aeoliella sp.]|uniref:DUF1598 domain-containing protein n=1 Tax=Aeoliella sp. TaxID=2795800 RepID=UPI003CCBD50D
MSRIRAAAQVLSLLIVTALSVSAANAQPNAFIPRPNDPNGAGGLFGRLGGQQNGLFNGAGQGQQNQGNGFPGGAANADFDSLIDLIISTVASDSWVENGGPEAEIRPFPGGVWVDAAGLLREYEERGEVKLTSLEVPNVPDKVESANPRESAKLRCVSLPRLEAAIYFALRDGKPLDESMLVLAGLKRVEYVFIYPEIGDVVLAGPAGDWRLDAEHRLVSTDDGTPVVRLDDLLTLLRRERSADNKAFGCSITPRQDNLAATQDYLQQSAAKPLPPGRRAREKWLEEIRKTMGRQDIEVFGLDPGTHAAHVLVKADHHMKRVGIGLEDGVPGVDSYLDTVVREKQGEQPLSVLRWWFSANYNGIARNSEGTGYELVGQGVEVLSENEMLTKRGERVHTGKADEATQQFAHQFTSEFGKLAQKYPVYGELRNLFDLAIVAAMLDAQDLYATAGWQPVLFLNDEHLPLPNYFAPREVDTIANHRVVKKTKILAAVSGGVWVDSHGVLAKHTTPSEKLDYHRNQAPPELAAGEWWWDLE